MATARPQLITFATSHFCEKARWALDWHGVSYDEVGWPPGLHQILAKRRGLKEAKVPILFTMMRSFKAAAPLLIGQTGRI